MTVARLLDECGSYELSEWMVHFQLQAEELEQQRREAGLG